MPNAYYNAPSNNIPLTTVRSANENTDRIAVESAFDLIPEQSDLQRNLYGIDVSTVSTLYEITVPYLSGAYVEGQEITWEANLASTGAANIQLNGGQIVPLVDVAGAALSAGIIGAGYMVKAIFTTANEFRLLNIVNVGTAAIDQTANYNWSGTHDFTLATVIGVAVDLTATYAWTGPHSYSQIPTINSDPVFHQANIKEAVMEVKTETGVSYTAVLADRNTAVLRDNAAANTFTIPLDSAVNFPVGTTLNVCQTNVGETTIDATVGVTTFAEIGTVINGQYGWATCLKTAANTWLITGSLKA